MCLTVLVHSELNHILAVIPEQNTLPKCCTKVLVAACQNGTQNSGTSMKGKTETQCKTKTSTHAVESYQKIKLSKCKRLKRKRPKLKLECCNENGKNAGCTSRWLQDGPRWPRMTQDGAAVTRPRYRRSTRLCRKNKL